MQRWHPSTNICSNTIIINYAYNDNGITVYPDLIKVKLALDNGEILGLESSGYLNSHKIRTHFEPQITLEKAKEKALEWLNEKGIKISETELEILIESAVNGLKGA